MPSYEKTEFLEGIYLNTSDAQISKAQQHFNENNERPNTAIVQCERFISQLDDDQQTEITTYTLDQLCKWRSSKGSKYSGSSSRTSNNSDHSQKQKLWAIENENRATRNLELLKMKTKTQRSWG